MKFEDMTKEELIEHINSETLNGNYNKIYSIILDKIGNKNIIITRTLNFTPMYDFTHLDYVRQRAEYQMLMDDFLRGCKTKEEKNKANRQYQGIGLISTMAAFFASLIVCGIISLFT